MKPCRCNMLLLLLVTLLVDTSYGQTLKVEAQPIEGSITPGSYVTLTVRIEYAEGDVYLRDIVWTRDNKAIAEDDERFRVNARGRELNIALIGLEAADETTFQCTVTKDSVSETAEFNINLDKSSSLNPVVTQGGSSNYVWAAGQTINVEFNTLNSNTNNLLSQVTFYRNYAPLEGSRYTVSPYTNSQRATLTITNAMTSDNGIYAVRYVTGTTDSVRRYGILAFTIKVRGNPHVTITPESARVTEGTDVTFTCNAVAEVTAPTYEWYINEVRSDTNTQKSLIIKDVKQANAAAYTCKVSYTTYSASATAYLVINEDNTLNVLTPFVIVAVSSQAVLSFELTTAEDISASAITWYKDSSKIDDNEVQYSSGKKQLIINSVRARDEGYYRVTVRLTTVTLEGSMIMKVKSARPVIKFEKSKYIGRTGGLLEITITSSGNPQPDAASIQWSLDDNPIKQNDKNVRFSDDFLTLSKSGITSSDAGTIKVYAETQAGSAEDTAVIFVIPQDEIQAVKETHNQLMGKSISIMMLFNIFPLPVEQNVQWSKSSEILTDTSRRIEFHESGRSLLIRDTELTDTGEYSISINKANGKQAVKKITVNIHKETEKVSIFSRPESTNDHYVGSDIKISCDARGTPSPEIEFYKGDAQVLSKDRVYITAKTLEIYNAMTTDSGSYKCWAKNGDTSDEQSFTITVKDRVSITAAKTSVAAAFGSSAKLEVTVDPANAVVTWTRDGVSLPESDGGHYDFVSDNTLASQNKKKWMLEINGVQSTDMGTYDATASYGDDERSVSITLSESSSTALRLTSKSGDVTVYRGENAKFSCIVSTDGAAITWTWDGKEIETSNIFVNRITLSSTKSELTIFPTLVTDTGVVMCKVEKDDQIIRSSSALTVKQPVKITSYPRYRRIVVGQTPTRDLVITIDKPSTGNLAITWTLNDASLDNNGMYSLRLLSPTTTGTDTYTVTAKLSNWYSNTYEDKVTIIVEKFADTLISAAQVLKVPEDTEAILGSTVTFECLVYGIPDPLVTWANGTTTLTSNIINTYTEQGVLSRLVIANVREDYRGEYRCKADNNIGAIQYKSAYLEILNPPILILSDPVQYGVPGKTVRLSVAVTYQNKIDSNNVKWSRNGEEVRATVDKYRFLNNGLTLEIVSVKSEFAGTYSCTVETEAGTTSTSINLEIISQFTEPQVSIPKYYDNLIALHESSYVLKCDVKGKPIPKVSWRINGTTVEPVEGVREIQSDASLKIYSVGFNDSGTWSCVGSSEFDNKNYEKKADTQLAVVFWLARPFVYAYHGHETITVVSGDELEVNIEVMYRYQIRAHNILWKKLDFGKTDWSQAMVLNTVDPGYDNVVEFRRNRRQLLVKSVSKIYEGQYMAIVTTVAGVANTTINVYVISRVNPKIQFLDTISENLYLTINGAGNFVFNVNVTGEPFPELITWSFKRNQEFNGITNSTLTSTGRRYTIGYHGNLHFTKVDRSAAGIYKIQVTPENGKQDQMREATVQLEVKDYALGLQTVPYLGWLYKEGTTVTITCTAIGAPDPRYVEWFKGISKQSSTTNELVISNINKNDRGEYYCVVKNVYGTLYSPKVKLQVQYIDDDFSPITCFKKDSNSEAVKDCASVSLEEGNVITLKCNGPSGFPYPKTTWYRDDTAVSDSFSKNGGGPVTNVYGDLIFPWADSINHSGKYHCQLINDEGRRANQNAKYDLKIQPSDSDIPNSKSIEWLVKPENIIVEVYTPVTIACIVSSWPLPTYEWNYRSNDLSTWETFDASANGAQFSFQKRYLYFSEIADSATGQYKCTAKSDNDDKERKEAVFKLDVARKPTFQNAPTITRGEMGERKDLEIKDYVDGYPAPTIVWTFNGQGIVLGGRINQQTDGTLRIDPVQAGDNGVFQVTATNKAGSAQHAVYLKVEEDLTFSKNPPTGLIEIPQYSTLVLPCEVSGTPPPSIVIWKREEFESEPFNGLPARAYLDKDNSLIIPYAQTWDNGTYTCVVTNEYFQNVSASGRIAVVEPPSIVIKPQNVYIDDESGSETNQKAEMICKCEPQAVATQPCKVEFLKDGVIVSGPGISLLKRPDFSYVLTFEPVNGNHIGTYECKGTNKMGSATATANIMMSNKPFQTESPAASLSFNSRSEVEVPCSAIGAAPLSYVWTRDDIDVMLLEGRDRYKIKPSGMLVISEAKGSDSGRYSCLANNAYGQINASTVITIVDTPLMPPVPWVTELQVQSSSASKFMAVIKVKSRDAYNQPRGYVLYVYECTDDSSVERCSAPSQEKVKELEWKSGPNQEYRWDDLSSKIYRFQVKLRDDTSESAMSGMSQAINFAKRLQTTKMPGNVRVEEGDENPRHLLLRWDAVQGDSTSPAATEYRVRYKMPSQTTFSVLGITGNTFINLTLLSELSPYQVFQFQVQGVNSNGFDGLASEPLSVKTKPMKPNPAVITGFKSGLNSNQLIVNFDSKWNLTNGVPGEFQFWVREKALSRKRISRQSSNPHTASSAMDSIVIDSLKPGVEYDIQVQSVGRDGEKSGLSNTYTKTTEEGLPGAPTIYFLEGSGRDAIQLNWTAPNTENGAIVGYYVYYRLDNSFTDISARITIYDIRHCNVTGLDEKTEYEFAVSAFTAAGEGEKSQWLPMSPRDISIPNKMETPVATVVNWHTVDVEWVLLDDGLTGIDTFTIYVDSAIERIGQSSYVIPNRDDRYAQITSLEEDITYVLSIVATNRIGTSLRSNGVEFRTPRKPLHLRVWFAAMITAILAFLFLVLFAFLFYRFYLRDRKDGLFVFDRKPKPKTGANYIAKTKPNDNVGVVHQNNHAIDNYRQSDSERYSTKPDPYGARVDSNRAPSPVYNDPRPSRDPHPSRDVYDNRIPSYSPRTNSSYGQPRNDRDRYPMSDYNRPPSENSSYNSRPMDYRYDDDRYSRSNASHLGDYPRGGGGDDRYRFGGPHNYNGTPPPDNNNNNPYNDDRYSDYSGAHSNNNNYNNNSYNDRNSNISRNNNYYQDDRGVVLDNPGARFSQI